jgi:glycosyltransferase involved in cell wall biosynthesis
MNKFALSVITPSFNQGHFLEECIDSVLSQSTKCNEYFVIDGGSTDNSVEIIKKYEKHLTYWVSEKDQGQSNAINKGFMLATSELVSWINSDDFYLAGAFEMAQQAHLKNPHASFYYGNGHRVNAEGEYNSLFYAKGTVEFSLDYLVEGLNYILQPTTFIQRSALRRINFLNENLHYGMDSDLWIRLAEFSPPKPIPGVVAATREYEHTKTATGGFERLEELRRIAKSHSGKDYTPGLLLYFLDTLYNYAGENPDQFSPAFKKHIVKFWKKAQVDFSRKGDVGIDGSPLKIAKGND